ncbi:MAG: hypothetical protein AB1393_09635 [Candidatus Edwardsbacteria bacterium]
MKKKNWTGLLKCEVKDGMFEGEQIVSFNIKGNTVSAIVDKESVRDKKRLEVDVYKKKGEEVLIGIPGEPFSTSRKIWVPQEEIE